MSLLEERSSPISTLRVLRSHTQVVWSLTLTDKGRVEEITKLREKEPDLKECFQIGLNDDPRGFKNRWIAESGSSVGFKNDILQFFEVSTQTK